MSNLGANVTPRLAVFAAPGILFLLGLSAVTASYVGVFVGGIGWDVEFDVGAYLQVVQLDHVSNLEAAYARIVYTSEFYGLLVPQVAELLWRLLGLPGVFAPGNLQVYQLLGVVNVSIALAGAAAVALAMWTIFRSLLVATFAWALVVSMPLYAGLASIDWKDIPIAVGVSFLSTGLVLSLTLSTDKRRVVGGVLFSSVGAVMAVASRPGAWIILTLIALCTLLILGIVKLFQGSFGDLMAPLVSVVIATLFTVIFLWLTNPIARLGIFQWLFDAAVVSQDNPWWGVVRTNGIDVNAANLPLWYPAAWLLAQLPLLTLMVLLLSALFVLGSWVSWQSAPSGRELTLLIPLLVQSIIAPALIVSTRPVIYDGIRHLLFLVPALLAVSAVSVAGLERRFQREHRPSFRAIPAVFAVVVVASSVWAIFRWFPYEYAFINPIAGRDMQSRDWELDYWGVSAIEGHERLVELGLSPVVVEPTDATARFVGAISRDSLDPETKEYGLYVFLRGDSTIGKCELLFSIKRDGHTLGQGAHCDLE